MATTGLVPVGPCDFLILSCRRTDGVLQEEISGRHPVQSMWNVSVEHRSTGARPVVVVGQTIDPLAVSHGPAGTRGPSFRTPVLKSWKK